MGFWGNLKTITTSTAKAVADSVELLSDLAGKAEEQTEILVLRSRAGRLQTQIEFLKREKRTVNETIKLKEELILVYSEIINKSSSSACEAIYPQKHQLQIEVIDMRLSLSLEKNKRERFIFFFKWKYASC